MTERRNHRIIRLRTQHHLTQKQLAEAVGISRSYLSLIEIGYRLPSLRVARRIAGLFYADPFVLFGELEDTT